MDHPGRPSTGAQGRSWRAVFVLPDGKRLTRTVRSDVLLEANDEERKAVLAYEMIEEFENVGHDFPEGRALLVELLGARTRRGEDQPTLP